MRVKRIGKESDTRIAQTKTIPYKLMLKNSGRETMRGHKLTSSAKLQMTILPIRPIFSCASLYVSGCFTTNTRRNTISATKKQLELVSTVPGTCIAASRQFSLAFLIAASSPFQPDRT